MRVDIYLRIIFRERETVDIHFMDGQV